MSSTHFRVIRESIVAWMSKKTLLQQTRNLKLKWLQLDSNPRPISSWANIKPFSQTDQMIELCCKYFIYLLLFIISFIFIRKRFFLSHIYRNRLFRPLNIKHIKILTPNILINNIDIYKKTFFTIKNGIYITLTNSKLLT